MFIELTDHLRCPAAHAEAFLVLLPERTEARRVVAGQLGCPICGWGVAWSDGVPDFGDGTRSSSEPPFDADAARAMLGLDGPGGWVALAGEAGALAHELAALLPGLHVVAVNPPPSVVAAGEVSIVMSATWPLKVHSMRGVVIGRDADTIRDAAIASALPGLRVVGAGATPSGRPDVELLAAAADHWVIRVR